MARTKSKAHKQPSQGPSQAPTLARAAQGLKALTKRIVKHTIDNPINKVAKRSTKVLVSPAKATVGKLPAKKAMTNKAPSGKSPRKSSVPARKSATKKSSLDVPKMPKRKRRRGVLALMEIRKFQRSTDLLIRKAPFTRLVREILQSVAPVKNSEHPWMVKKEALLALQEACEAHMVTIMEETQLAALHAQRITIMPKDLQLAKRLRMDHVLMQDTFRT